MPHTWNNGMLECWSLAKEKPHLVDSLLRNIFPL